jgi:hypothetical protein
MILIPVRNFFSEASHFGVLKFSEFFDILDVFAQFWTKCGPKYIFWPFFLILTNLSWPPLPYTKIFNTPQILVYFLFSQQWEFCL